MFPREENLSLGTTLWRGLRFVPLVMLSACGGGGGDGDEGDTPTISVADVSIVEGDSGNTDLVFTITGSVASPTDIAVDYATADGTAINPNDYVQSAGTLTMPAGSTSVDVVVPIVGDSDVETDETFMLTLSNPTASAVIGVGTATGTIVNDDNAVVPTISISDSSISEGTGNNTVLSFSVDLDTTAADDVTADYVTADGSASSPDDYAQVSGSILIAAGDTTVSIDVTVIADSLDEGNEAFTMTLSNISPSAMPGTVNATGTIEDDDDVAVLGMLLNDTGFTQCTSPSGYDQLCNDSATGTDQFPGQDAEHGRDFTDNDDNDGHAGFSFTKLDSNGIPLADQTANYGQNPWNCVRDEVTGLTWEVKTDSGDLHDNNWSYSWYESSGVNDGGDPGEPDEGVCLSAERCDTEKYTEDVNAENYCGFSDWRQPTRVELLSLMDYSADYQPVISGWKTAFIDATYFPNTNLVRDYWTTSAGNLGRGKRVIAFDGEPSRSEFTVWDLSVRLVRGGN